jgi:hypothetical protein
MCVADDRTLNNCLFAPKSRAYSMVFSRGMGQKRRLLERRHLANCHERRTKHRASGIYRGGEIVR